MNDIVIFTPTINEYITVIEYYIRTGIIWCDGYTGVCKNCWFEYKQRTYVMIENHVLGYGDIGYLELDIYNQDILVLTMKEFYYKIKCIKIFGEFV